MPAFEMNFCRRCGSTLNQKGPGYFICEENHTIFQNPVPTVGVFFFDDKGNVILTRRGIEPNKGMLDAVGGFVDINDESAEAAAIREIKEETGLQPNDYENLAIFYSASWKYPYGDENIPVTMTAYTAKLKPGSTIAPLDDVSEIIKLPLADVKLEEVGNGDVKKAFIKLRESILEQ